MWCVCLGNKLQSVNIMEEIATGTTMSLLSPNVVDYYTDGDRPCDVANDHNRIRAKSSGKPAKFLTRT